MGVRDQMSSSEVGMGRVLYLQWVCQMNEEQRAGSGKVQQGVEGRSCATVEMELPMGVAWVSFLGHCSGGLPPPFHDAVHDHRTETQSEDPL